MKRFSYILAMLALVLVLGLAFVGCGGGGGEVPRTIEGLFDELKGFNTGNLYANNSANELIVWCAHHKAWEPRDDDYNNVHGGTPTFDFAAATRLQGSYNSSELYDANSMVIRDIIKTLDSFFENQYKTGATDTYNYGTSTWSYDMILYTFYLNRSGAGAYAASAEPVRREAGVPFTFTVDRYQF